jgi:hypothetical protein
MNYDLERGRKPMTTEAQIQANRANAQKSTGPRTPEGKEKAGQNAWKHGLFAREGAIRGEDEREFEEYRENLLSQLIPGTPLEETLAERVVDLSWRLKRAARDQEKAFVVLYAKQTAGVGEALEPAQRDATIGWMIVADFCGEAVLDRLLRYERRIESSMYRALNELRRVHDQAQKARQEVLETRARWKEEDWEAKKARMFRSCPPPEPDPTTNTPAPGGAVVQTNPISGSAGGDEAWGARDEGQLCETNPISTVAAVETEEAGRVSGTIPPVQSEMCETNPIARSGAPEAVSDGGGSRRGGYTPIFRRRR